LINVAIGASPTSFHEDVLNIALLFCWNKPAETSRKRKWRN